ncbi:MAG: precorrin-4 C(11)-methyltransferase [Halobacteria archaeon]
MATPQNRARATEGSEGSDFAPWPEPAKRARGGRVIFVGAGPGDPGLITVKGLRALKSADAVVFAGSLISPGMKALFPRRAERWDSAKMTLEEIHEAAVEAVRRGKTVVRLHDGDPAIFGALEEQLRLLEEDEVPYELVPGVSSFLAAAAALGQELTIPEVSQTVIISRAEGRTPVPERESLKSLASHGAVVALFLSAGLAGRACRDLRAGGLPPDTPAMAVYRASWPDQRVVRGTLADLPQRMREASMDKTTLILAGPALGTPRKGYSTWGPNGRRPRSRLYDPSFTHGYRKAKPGGGKR